MFDKVGVYHTLFGHIISCHLQYLGSVRRSGKGPVSGFISETMDLGWEVNYLGDMKNGRQIGVESLLIL